MKLKLIVLAILTITILPVLAQTSPGLFAVKGVVKDSISQKPSEFVTIILKNEAKEIIKTAVTKDDGSFLLERVAAGKYTVALSSIEYTPKVLPLNLSAASNSATDLGTILAIPVNNQLAAVSVKVDKPIIKQEVDKLSYDLQADPDSKSNNVLDMMRKVPMLSVDADDNILLKGQAGYKILINGKPSGMMERDPKNILKSMPASTIQSIEVITNPSSKYDAEGVVGLINIITTKKIDNGYNGSLNLSSSFPVGGPRSGGSFFFKQGKLGASAYFGANISNSPQVRNSIARQTVGASPTSLSQNNTSEWDGRNGYGEIGLSYEIDSLNLLSGQFNINGGRQDGLSNQSSFLNGSSGLMQRYDLFNDNKNKGKGINAQINYQLGFKSNKQRLLTFSYLLMDYTNTQYANLTASNRLNYAVPDYRQANEGKSSEQNCQIDYVHPVKKWSIEAGAKAVIRDNNSDFQYRSYNSSTGIFEVDPARSNKFDNNQNVYSLYNSYSYTLKNWAFKAGARVEETIIDADFISTSSQLNKSFLNVVPSLSINRKFSDMSTLNLGFSQRIQRPGIYQLNPFVDRSNPNFESSGNPNLRPAVSNNLQLAYSKSKKASLNLVLGYNYFNDLIMQVASFNAATNVTRSSFDNTGKARLFTFNTSINYPITKKWSSSFNGRIMHGRVEGMVNGALVKNEGIMYGASANTSYNFEKGWRVSTNAYLNGPDLYIQGTSNPYASVSFSVNKDVVKDKLSLSASANNPFSKYRNNIRDSFGPDFTQSNVNRTYFRGFNVSMNYRFGKLKETIKKNKRGISNDDVQNN